MPSSAARATGLAGAGIPYARTILALDLAQLAVVQRTVELLFRTAHSEAYQRRVDPGAGPTALHDAGSFGVFMGYDFHLTEAGPRLIEVNTNAGGALLNGLHTAESCKPAELDWLCCDPPPIESIERFITDTFRAEMAAVHGPDATLRTLAIADERPDEQFLRPEFELFRDLFARSGIEARICDTGELVRGRDGGVELGGSPVDLVYLRDTDFQLATPRTAALREAFLEDRVVVTPCPREHHLLADKRRLTIFSSERTLRELGLSEPDAAFLAEVVPETRVLADLGLDEAWRTRRQWVFKPAAAFGSRAVYRGDKISRRRLAGLFEEPGFLAQRRVAPGEVPVETPEGPTRMKFDVRAYAYRDRIFLLGARVYQGQVTNMRSPGGGFSAICVARDREAADACCPAAER